MPDAWGETPCDPLGGDGVLPPLLGLQPGRLAALQQVLSWKPMSTLGACTPSQRTRFPLQTLHTPSFFAAVTNPSGFAWNLVSKGCDTHCGQ